MNVVILAAGMGTRLRTYTEHLPKGMLPVRGRPLLEWQLESLRQSGIREIHVVTGYRAEAVRLADVHFHHNPAFAETNMLVSLLCAEPALEGDVLVAYADLLYTPELVRLMLDSQAEVAVAADEDWQPYWRLRYGTIREDLESFRLDERGRIAELGRPCTDPEEMRLRYIGLIKFSASAIAAVKALYRRREALNAPWPASGKAFAKGYMTDLLQELVAEGREVCPARTRGHWLEFDTDADYELMEKEPEALRALLPWPSFWAAWPAEAANPTQDARLRLPAYSFAALELDGGFSAALAARRAKRPASVSASQLTKDPEPAAFVAKSLAAIQSLLAPEAPPKSGGQASAFGLISKAFEGYSPGGGFSVEGSQILDTFQKKFEVFKQLFSLYDHNLRRIGGEIRHWPTYALLSLALQFRFLHGGCFNDLSTALKLNDLLAGECTSNHPLSSRAFACEVFILDRLR